MTSLLKRATVLGAALVAVLSSGGGVATAGSRAPDLGPNVIVFDPGQPISEIRATVDAIHRLFVENPTP